MERRAAALLAYLGLEGPSSKSSIASLLWPDSPPVTVRNNMRQLLRRLRLLCGGVELVEADSERLALAPMLQLDVASLRAAAGTHSYDGILDLLRSGGSGGALLSGFHFDECEELARWLDGARAAVEGWVRNAREAEIQRHVADHAWAPALALAQDWVQQEPESEQAGRHLIRLHYLRGDRGAALSAFERLRATLSHDLGVSPMPDTLSLVRQIEKGSQVARPAPVSRPALPLTVLRPPLLAGRESAWRELQEGFDAGQMLFITGEPGTGKSRLAEEFAAAQGRWTRSEARPGDQDVPFASQARAFRIQLARRPDVTLPDRLRAELSRFVPELGDSRPTPPLVSEADELRFFEAHAEALLLLLEGEQVVVVDDVQYWDNASARLFMYAFTQYRDRRVPIHRLPCFIDCYRRDELPAYSEANVRKLVDVGVARVIDLSPLSIDGVRQLLGSLELPGAEAHTEALTRYTGGNPLYIVETLKHLLETDSLHKDWPHRLPPPGRVGPLIQRRLERLSVLALQVAQLAACAGSNFRAAHIPEALEVSAASSHAALSELEATQLLVGERFSHDLVLETVQATIGKAVGRFLHGRLAAVLEREGTPANLLAHHWLEAGQEARALPHLFAAAQADEELRLLEQAADHHARAAAILEAAGRHEEAARTRAAEVRCRSRKAAPPVTEVGSEPEAARLPPA
ncbi:AAA family ATPase [Pyxidicoccus xibeiensis]|uniref:AAA family ATPase n=1 Tax=Pyxidicoccus xibeiensis TaxID=2906759 RepID=UPI0020A70F9D|nr:AAA family ATPase [Pyxidicoccus xibeiensis]MCP3141950.1 AAA family ATPase [Pyxidicoccus xibeiensis]